MFSTKLLLVFIFIWVQIHLNQAIPVDEQEKIIGGTDVPDNQFPWEVSIGSIEGVPKEKNERQSQPLQTKLDTHLCGGVLLSKDYVVTLARCVTQRASSNALPTSSIGVGLGSKRLADIYDQGRVPVSEIIVMPGFHWFFTVGNKDLALLKISTPSFSGDPLNLDVSNLFDPFACLSDPVKCFTNPSSPVRPACLPKSALPEKQNYPSPLTAVGWGNTKSYTLKESELRDQVRPYVSPTLKQVNIQDASATEEFCPTKLICFASTQGTKGPCEYDSGDSLVLNGDIVVGIENIVYTTDLNNGGMTTCTDKIIYSRISSFTEWIQSHVGGDLCLK